MNYELALALKNAGFTQPEKYEAYNPETGLWEYDANLKGILPYAPTLSELIEACGDKFKNLSVEYGTWYCNQKPMFEDTVEADGVYDGMDSGDSSGSTPEEAVAKLWFELNK